MGTLQNRIRRALGRIFRVAAVGPGRLSVGEVALPHRVTVENTHRCNLRCPFCLHTLHQGPSPSMSAELFDSLARDAFPSAREVGLSVTGEPMLSPRFDEECRKIADSGARLVTYTNGTKLASALESEDFRRAVGGLFVSLDGARAETFDPIRPPGGFDEIVRGIRAYDRWRRTREPRPGLELVIVLQQANIREIEEWVRLAADLGADRIAASHLVAHTPEQRVESLANSPEGRACSDEFLTKAKDVALEIGIPAEFPDPFGARKPLPPTPADPPGSSNVRICDLPWSESWVSASGDVYPCCFPDKVPSMGNIADGGFRDVWNGADYRDWRSRLESASPPEPCRTCHLARSAPDARFDILRETAGAS